jgi:hypothetical protein
MDLEVLDTAMGTATTFTYADYLRDVAKPALTGNLVAFDSQRRCGVCIQDRTYNADKHSTGILVGPFSSDSAD